MRKLYLLLLTLVFLLSGCKSEYVPNTSDPGNSNKPLQITITEADARAALEVALQNIDKPYVYGGRGPDVFDCSGLITFSYKIALGRENIFLIGTSFVTSDATMIDLYYYNTEPLPNEQIKPGDIVFITAEQGKVNHGGLFVRWVDEGIFEFINASSYFGKVVIDTWPTEEIKRDQWFMGAGRLKIVVGNN